MAFQKEGLFLQCSNVYDKVGGFFWVLNALKKTLSQINKYFLTIWWCFRYFPPLKRRGTRVNDLLNMLTDGKGYKMICSTW